MTTGPNHYQLLGVNADAGEDEIRRAYRAKAKSAHPDAGGDPSTFRQLLDAYQTLVRPDRRRDYDDMMGIRARQATDPDGGRRDAAWDGRRGDFSGDVSFPAWMRGITDEQWTPAPPDEESLPDPSRVATERAAARDRPPTARRAQVVWWWPHRAIGPPVAIGDQLVLASERALVTIAADDGRERGRLAFSPPIAAAPVAVGDRAVVWTNDGVLHGVALDRHEITWDLAFGPPAPGAAVATESGRSGPLVLAGRADARLVAIRTETGDVAWAAKLEGPATQPPAVDDGLAVVVSGQRTVEAIDVRTGRHRWRIHVPNPVLLPPRVVGYSVWLAGGGPAGALVRLDMATGAVQATFGAGDAIGGLSSDGRSVLATAAGPARLLILDELGRVEAAIATQRVCAEPAATPSFAYLADPSGRVLTIDRRHHRIAAVSEVLFEPVGAPLVTRRHLVLMARDGHVWAIVRPEEQLVGDGP